MQFGYDALGRRTQKLYRGKRTRWVWDGDVPLHEWSEYTVGTDMGSVEEVITWLFDPDSFAPMARLTNSQRLSVVADHLGTPLELIDEGGGVQWGAQLDAYGRIRQGRGQAGLCPFRYQGQYEDSETGLYYNRFRYYNPQEGMYISQDPIGLEGNKSTLYGYVNDSNSDVNELGLQGGGSYSRTRAANVGGETNHIPAWNSIEIAKQRNPSLPNMPTHGSTPSTHMDKADHRQMTTTGRSRGAVRWRERQADLFD